MALPDHLLEFAAEPPIVEHLQMRGEDGRVLVAELLGEDPLAPDTIERQTQFLRKLARVVAGNYDTRSTRR